MTGSKPVAPADDDVIMEDDRERVTDNGGREGLGGEGCEVSGGARLAETVMAVIEMEDPDSGFPTSVANWVREVGDGYGQSG